MTPAGSTSGERPGPSALRAAAALLLRRRAASQTEHLSLALVEGSGPSPVLLMTVPKKLLARAVDRNQFRRVARAYWRLRPTSMRGLDALVRLRRRPEAFANWPRGERSRRWRDELAVLFGAAAAPRGRP